MCRYVDGQNSTRQKVGTLLPFITANEEEGKPAAKLIILSPGKTLARSALVCHVCIATSAVGQIKEVYTWDSAASALPGWQIMYVADVAG